MANSITLSQSLVDDIAQKITDGTATAEQVVLYTKGLNQLQTGNDFQSVVIGLSQSAVDAIDSANAQFQEDATSALATFSQTSTNIDTSATNAVSAINVAKDTLVATDAGISSTIANLPSLTFIRNAVKNDREYIHPYERPAFWAASSINQGNYESIITFYNHYGKQVVMPEIGASQFILKNNNTGIDSTSNYFKDANGKTYHRYNGGSAAPFQAYRTTTTTSGYEGGFAKSKNTYGHVMGTWSDSRGIWHGYNYEWDSAWMRDNGVIVGDTDKTWFLNRTSTNFYVGGTRGIYRFVDDNNERAKLRDNLVSLTGVKRPYVNDLQWEDTHEKFTLPAPVSTGYGNVCYNATLNQMVVMQYDNTGGRQKPLLYTFASDFNLKNIAKGTQEITSGYDPTSESKMTLAIESTVNNGSGIPGSPNNTETNHRGIPVLCDNGKIVHFRSQGNGVSGSNYAFRWELDASGTDYVKDAHFTYSGQTTKYGMEQGEYYGVRHQMSNDSRYVLAYDNYYYYHSGARVMIIRVSDGKVVKWTNNETSWGWSYTPVQANKFIVKLEPHHAYNNQYLIDLDFIFANNADGSDVDLASGSSYAAHWMPDLANIQPYTAYFSMNIDYSHEMDYISAVDKLTDTRTI